MIKYKCEYCGGHCELIVRHNEDKLPYGCPFDPSRIKKEVKKETTTKTSRLPKLTAKVFKRPAKALPDWCKVGRCGYDNEQERYFEVTNIDKKWVDIEYLDDGIGATCDYSDIQKCSEARKRPYNAEEMKALVGKIITSTDGDVSIITDYSPHSAEYNVASIYFIGGWSTADELLKYNYTIDGKPCYVLEHLESGEWVK